MSESGLNNNIAEIKLEAARQIQRTIINKAITMDNFPTAQLASNGFLTDVFAVIVDYGHPPIKQGYSKEPYPAKPSYVLTRAGLFITSNFEKAKSKDGNYMVDAPSLDEMIEAPLEAYLTYGEKAIDLLQQK